MHRAILFLHGWCQSILSILVDLLLHIWPEEADVQPPHDGHLVVLVPRPHLVPPPLHLGPDVAAPVVLLVRFAPQLKTCECRCSLRTELPTSTFSLV